MPETKPQRDYNRISRIRKRFYTALGIPPLIFQPDFQERFERAQKKNAEMLERIRRFEKEDPDFWCNLPWAEARKEWEATEGYKNLPCTDLRVVAEPYVPPCITEFHRQMDRKSHPLFYQWWSASKKKAAERKAALRQEELLRQAQSEFRRGLIADDD